MTTPLSHLPVLVVCSIFQNVAWAGSVAYTSEYLGDVPPTATKGTLANPAWEEKVGGANSVAELDGRALVASTMDAAGPNTQFWVIGDSDGSLAGTPEAWSVSSPTGATVDIRIQVTAAKANKEHTPEQAGGFMIQVADGDRGVSFYFGPDRIIATGATSYTSTQPLDLSTAFTTFRITMQDGRATLYMADMDAPLFSGIEGTATLLGYNRLLFGDFTSAYSGAYRLAYIKWNNGTAEFSAPPADPGSN